MSPAIVPPTKESIAASPRVPWWAVVLIFAVIIGIVIGAAL